MIFLNIKTHSWLMAHVGYAYQIRDNIWRKIDNYSKNTSSFKEYYRDHNQRL